MTKSKYTYSDFANEAISIGTTGKIDNIDLERFMEKAQALLISQENKKAYNETHPKKSTSKGASENTRTLANAITKVLTATPATGAEIATALNNPLSALQIANACKFIENCQACKVVRTTVNSKGLSAEKEYTAYFID